MQRDNEDILEDGELESAMVGVRNVAIKTDNRVKNLESQLKTLLDDQQNQRRRQVLSSGIAYLLFVLLIGLGARLSYQTHLEKHKAVQARAEARIAAFEKERAQLKAEVGRWTQIERDMLELQSLVNSGRKEEAVSKFSALKRVRFSGLLEDLVVRFKEEVAREKFEQGVEHFEKGRFDQADRAFVRSLEYLERPSYLGDLLFHQGMSALRLKDFARASSTLRTSLAYKHRRPVLAEARYHLAYAHDRMGEKRTAKDLYFRFYNAHPKHRYAQRAKRRHKALKKR